MNMESWSLADGPKGLGLQNISQELKYSPTSETLPEPETPSSTTVTPNENVSDEASQVEDPIMAAKQAIFDKLQQTDDPMQQRELLAQLFVKHTAVINTLVKRICFNEDDRQEILQDTWLNIQRTLQTGTIAFDDVGKLLNYMRTAAMNTAVSQGRKNKVRQNINVLLTPRAETDTTQIDEAALDFDLEEYVVTRQTAAEVLAHVATSAARGAVVADILLRYYGHRDKLEEIAEDLGIKPFTVKSRAFYGRQRAADYLRHLNRGVPGESGKAS